MRIFLKNRDQYVCKQCGYNIIGHLPDKCPFCRASSEQFILAHECSEQFSVVKSQLTNNIFKLTTKPNLGIEHTSWQINAATSSYWIDCPACFDPKLKSADIITFTHHHTLGACNLYREKHQAKVRINRSDSQHKLSQPFDFDELIEDNYIEDGLEAYHIGGHTPGYTMFIFDETLFTGDYFFTNDQDLKLNPHGNKKETLAGAKRLANILKTRPIKTVCGWDTTPYEEWQPKFAALLGLAG
ncbi:MAG: MBL fold metallo-hydrolase [Magnetococcales bacterium]|nr:MBL fold metallo-hydrolase [Magnetococcales bacterium]